MDSGKLESERRSRNRCFSWRKRNIVDGELKLIESDLACGLIKDLQRDARGRWHLVAGKSTGELITVPFDVGHGRLAAPNWLAQWTAPLHWHKYHANPIYGPQDSG